MKLKTWIILILTFIAAIAAISSAFYSYKNYKLEVAKFARQEDILFSYSFSDNHFEVIPSEDVEIREVKWIMPEVNQESSLGRIVSSSQFLPLKGLASVAERLQQLIPVNLSFKERANFVNCYVFAGLYYERIPLLIEISFREKGKRGLSEIANLLYIKGISIEYPYIEIHSTNVSREKEREFLIEEGKKLRSWLSQSKYVEINKLVDEEGNCRVKIY